MIKQIQLPHLLGKLELKGHANEIRKDKFRYTYDLGVIDFVSLSGDENEFFRTHDEIWCENKTEFFLALIENEEIHICDSKTKPDQKNPIKNASIDSFRYGENSEEERKYLRLFKKENIDTGECYREIKKFFKDRKRISVDKDLIRNLELRRKRIVELLRNKVDKEEIAQKLIDRCLFIRFLEDKSGRNELKKTLERENIIELLELFDFYSEHLNGDVFEEGDIPADIDKRIVNELTYIFGHMYTRPDSQTTLVPYNFENIPIILISNIYEEFLSKGERRSEGIVFTPENVVEYVVDEILKDNQIVDKIKGKKIKILDPACGSGVFLVKFLEKIIEKMEKKKGESLLRKKASIVENCLYGIDKNDNALRIAALSLYLKIIEGEKPEIIDKELFSEGSRFMFPGLKENGILVNGDSLFDTIFNGEKFDIIVGNPPWGLKFTNEEKREIKKYWPNVSKYQSSQCFLFRVEKWMKEDGVCGMIVNLSNFINTESEKFRSDFMKKYSLKSFVNLSRIKKITFGMKSESACIVFFTKPTTAARIDFFTPDISYFSESTGVISEDNKSEGLSHKLKRNDYLWHIHALGYSGYADLLEFLDSHRYCLGDFAKRKGFEEGLHEKSKELGMSKKQFNEKYKASSKITEDYYPIIDSLLGFLPYFGKEKQEYLFYGAYLERKRNLNLFKGKKLIITRSWPMRASIDSDTTLYDTRFWIFKLKNGYPEEYLSLFESILNSKLVKCYLGVKYLLRPEGNYTKVNKSQLKHFPIPVLEKNEEILDKIIRTVNSLKSLGPNETSVHKELQNQLDTLVFELYDLDDFAVQQVEDYYNLEIQKKRKKISNIELSTYCEEFIRDFTPFIKNKFFLNADWYISDFFGAMVKFTFSRARRPMNCDNEDLERFTPIIERQEIDKKRIFKEEKIKVYDDNKLYIYKSNKPKDWTRLMAIKDVNEEIGIIFKKWGEL